MCGSFAMKAIHMKSKESSSKTTSKKDLFKEREKFENGEELAETTVIDTVTAITAINQMAKSVSFVNVSSYKQADLFRTNRVG